MASCVKPKMRQFWKWLNDGQTEEAVISITNMGMHVAICSRAFDNHSSCAVIALMCCCSHYLSFLFWLSHFIITPTPPFQRLYESQTHGVCTPPVMTWWDEAREGVGPKPWASYSRWDGASAIALGPIGQHELHGHPKIV